MTTTVVVMVDPVALSGFRSDLSAVAAEKPALLFSSCAFLYYPIFAVLDFSSAVEARM
tara:strand:- start:530 stop:703 length:174 start_codon:yes stop_codon:yes gene_type:complete